MQNMQFVQDRDIEKLIKFLGRANVKEERLEKISHQFMILKDEKQDIIAVIGYEPEGDCALIRTLIMSPVVDKSKFVKFFEAFLQQLHKKKLQKLYLITNKPVSAELFRMFNFSSVDNSKVDLQIRNLDHYKKAMEQPNAFVLECELFTELSTDQQDLSTFRG
ncbi:mechanosensitive ion channel protein [Bacillus sp. 165]|uniref:mechanosensitive ion channel protein n=1 Tax=Bacillus sp. 165 TaxID=1529117 RepID=UPI001ADA10E5|nr:mechanosensitive ion channel protein [Bacillus sp. 165]MBO9130085.1 mechanosensitive ion channel protein [Bacillus sp. 165]